MKHFNRINELPLIDLRECLNYKININLVMDGIKYKATIKVEVNEKNREPVVFEETKIFDSYVSARKYVISIYNHFA